MRQAIITSKFRGSHIRATAQTLPGDIVNANVPHDFALNREANHCAAAKALAVKLQWHGVWFGGALPDGTGFAYVNVSDQQSESHESMGRLDHDWFYLPRNG